MSAFATMRSLFQGRIPALAGPFEAGRFREGFREAFTRFFSFAAELGFTIANCCYPMSDEQGAVYQATSTDPFISFTPGEKKAMLQALKDVVPEFRSQMRLFTPISSLDALISQCDGQATKTYACRGGLDFFFVDASKGHAYPCGYRSAEDMGLLWECGSCRRGDRHWRALKGRGVVSASWRAKRDAERGCFGRPWKQGRPHASGAFCGQHRAVGEQGRRAAGVPEENGVA